MREHSRYLALTFNITQHCPEIQTNLHYFLTFIFICIGVLSECMSVNHMYAMPVEPEEGVGSLGTRDMAVNHHVGPLEQPVTLIAPVHVYLKSCKKNLQLGFVMVKV